MNIKQVYFIYGKLELRVEYFQQKLQKRSCCTCSNHWARTCLLFKRHANRELPVGNDHVFVSLQQTL